MESDTIHFYWWRGWLLSLSVVILKCIRVVEISNSLLFVAEADALYGCDTYTVLMFSWTFGYLKFGVCQPSRSDHLCTISVWTCACISFGYKPKRINGLFDNCMFKWNCQTFPKWRCHLHCHQECLSSRSSTFVPIRGMVSFHWHCSVGSVVLAHLYLHFPRDSDIERLSMHFDLVYLLWRSVCLNLLPIIYCVFAILIVSVVVLYVCYIKVWCQLHVSQISSLSVWLTLSFFVRVSFERQSFLF